MATLTAENNFREGLVALAGRRFDVAAQLFQTAMQEQRRSGEKPRMAYLSYYGLSLALSEGPTRQAIQACEVAARRDFYNANLFFNLGKAYMLAGETTRALATLEKGRMLDSRHKGIKKTLRKWDRRSNPVLGWLGRNNPLNFWLGRMRSRRTERVDVRVKARPADIGH